MEPIVESFINELWRVDEITFAKTLNHTITPSGLPGEYSFVFVELSARQAEYRNLPFCRVNMVYYASITFLLAMPHCTVANLSLSWAPPSHNPRCLVPANIQTTFLLS